MKNIIYIEDDELQASLIQNKIQRLGHHCQIFYSMAFLKTHIEASISKIDLIISDVNGVSMLGISEDLKGVKSDIIVTSVIKYDNLNYPFVQKSELDFFLENYLKS